MDEINWLYSLIGTPLGYLLYWIYELGVKNVGLAIIIFTFLVKLVMLPLSVKQQKNTAKSAIFAPKVKEIQTKYKNNQEKQQQELAKLQQQGYSPMGGCGSMILTFLLLFGVLDVVYRPLTHIAHQPATGSDSIDSMIETAYDIKTVTIFVDEYNLSDEEVAKLNGDALKRHEDIIRDGGKIVAYYNENLPEGKTAVDSTVWTKVSADTIDMVEYVFETALKDDYDARKSGDGNGHETILTDTDLFTVISYARKDANSTAIPSEKEEFGKLTNDADKTAYNQEHAFGKTRDLFVAMNSQYGQYKILSSGEVKFVPSSSLQRELYVLDIFGTVKEYPDGTTVEFKQFFNITNDVAIQELYDNLDFLGIMLVHVPSEHLNFAMIMLIVVATALSLLQAFISNRQMEKNNPGAVGNGMKITMYAMPLFSLFFVINVPAGAGFYWTISYVFGIIQTVVLNKVLSPAKLKEQAEAEYKEKMKQLEKQAKRVRDTDHDNTIVEVNGEKLTQKEINRRKLAEARKADALKYGEEYIEDDED